MAHNQPDLLKKLFLLLDDERNDIYVHIDKKFHAFNKKEFDNLIKKANIYWVKRMDVKWGGYSQIECELILLKEAIKKEHSYYHLLSGVDLPLKTQDEIHAFFDMHEGLEFVDEDQECIDTKVLDRIKYFYFFSNRNGKIAKYFKTIILKLQKKLGVNRIQKYDSVCFQKGRNWFSITHKLATHVVEKEKWIYNIFSKSFCGDEVFLQTIARNSNFTEKICNLCTMPKVPDTRHIDWERGIPYVFRETDYEELKNTSALFARKFDINLDKNIIEKIYADLY